MEKYKIVVVDDDEDILRLISIYLKNEDYEVAAYLNSVDALNHIDSSVALCILDIAMPDVDGFTLCRTIRQQYKMPIIFLTAKGLDTDKIVGFSAGADDYIVKPFNSVDLIARVKSNIRRYYEYNYHNNEEEKIIIKDLEINLANFSVYIAGKEIKLTKSEYGILEFLAKNANNVYSVEDIYRNVWNMEVGYNAENVVFVHMKKLREKLNKDDNQRYIKTVWGFGYKIEK